MPTATTTLRSSKTKSSSGMPESSQESFTTPGRKALDTSNKSNIQTTTKEKEVIPSNISSSNSTVGAPTRTGAGGNEKATATATTTTTTPTSHHVTPLENKDETPGSEIRTKSPQPPTMPMVEHQVNEEEEASPTEETTRTAAAGSELSSKQVRFDAKKKNAESSSAVEPEEDSSKDGKKGQNNNHFVSRRGRFLSPARRASPPSSQPQESASTTAAAPPEPTTSSEDGTAVQAEYKTFRSPNRKQHAAAAGDEVPSLCSAPSSETAPSLPSSSKGGGGNSSNTATATNAAAPSSSASAKPTKTISCVAETVTSPLGGTMGDGVVTVGVTTTSSSSNQKTTSAVAAGANNKASSKPEPKRAYTPPPTTSTNNNKKKAAQTKANHPGEKLLDDTNPGIFLSPGRTGFEEKKQSDSPPARAARDAASTPTDFSMDYGKNNPLSASFDTSNVLAWLQSPTANGLFSPGGYGSILNTPGAGPRTPRTPTVSTSFFFSDVASLPRGDQTPSKGAANNGDGGAAANGKRKGGISNIICISPLASSKGRNQHQSTPMNLKDVFMSPEAGSSSVALDDSTPARPAAAGSRVQRSSSKDPSLDAVHLAERDLMEDEDMSVLLQLASNTPRSSAAAGVVFRSPNRPVHKDKKGENLPALQLPMIGGQEPASAAAAGGAPTSAGLRLERQPPKSKSSRADAALHHRGDDFAPPQLGMRSSSSSGTGSKEIVAGRGGGAGAVSSSSVPSAGRKGKDSSSKDKSGGGGDKGSSASSSNSKLSRKAPTSSNAYPTMPPPYPHRDMPSYYPHMPPGSMPPGMPSGPGGSMRVSVGIQRPPKGSPPRPGMSGSPPLSRPQYHDFPPRYPPPPGMYSQYGPPPPPGMGYPPPPYHQTSHYPPPPPHPRHMQPPGMYGAHGRPPPPQSKKSSKSSKSSKSGSASKRPATAAGEKPAKKPKKSPSSGRKKKTTSPAARAERQKAVAASMAAVNQAAAAGGVGGKNDKAAALAAAILRGVTMRPSGKWQAQLYFAGKSRYIGVFDSREKAALAYEIAREKLKSGPQNTTGTSTENLVNAARKAAFEGVNERLK